MGEKTLLEKVFIRKQVKEEAEKIPLTIGQMQEMFNDYGIRVFNTETKELEIVTRHTATTADLLSVIKYYEDNSVKLVKDLTSLSTLSEPNSLTQFIEEKKNEFLKNSYNKGYDELVWRAMEANMQLSFTLGQQNKIAGIIWEKRYSTTEADDKFGRWMRMGRINEMTVAIIIKAVHLEKIKYVVLLPNNKGDESLQSDIMANSEDEAMLEAEKFIAGYVANFRKI